MYNKSACHASVWAASVIFSFVILQPDNKGKYVFDIGCQQHGNYVGVEQPDEKNEEEEAAPTLVPKWKAGEITEIRLEPDEEDLVGDGAGDAPAGEDSAAAEGE